jgi:short-subunit dehydrogenase
VSGRLREYVCLSANDCLRRNEDKGDMDIKRYGPWALIVGGSEGIGAAFARKLAAKAFNIVLVARKSGPLEEVANDVRKLGVEVRTVSTDLSKPDALQQVRTVTDDVEIGFLIFNAGANHTRGNLVELDPVIYRDIIAITVSGQTEFVHHYGGLMWGRKRGAIILGGSSSSFIGSATLAPYTAAKAYSRIFSESLWAECRPMGIDVLHMVISFTDTPAMRRLGLNTTTAQSPDDAAQEALDNLRNGPLLLCGGPKAVELAFRRNGLENRAELIGLVSTPRREAMPHVKS